MRNRRSREINVFSMSALDLFSSGLGAFLILMLILFPFYKKDSDASAAVKKSQEALSNCQQQLQQAQQSLSQCSKKLGSGMLLVLMSWESADKRSGPDDMDIYVTDPDGNKYYFGQPNNNPPGRDFPTKARISIDNQNTPGFEVFEDPGARQGRYSISVKLYSKANRGSQPLKVRLVIYTRDGGTEMPIITINPLSDTGQTSVATVDVGASGDVQINR